MLAPFDMSFELTERRWYPGDQLDAVLEIDAGKTAEADIHVWLEARLHGKGNGHSERFLGKSVFRGELSEGRHRYPIALPVPNGPFTYRGTLVNVTWFVCARAEVPWAIDPKCESEFVLEYRPTGMELQHVPDVASFDAGSQPMGAGIAGLALGVAFGLFAVIGVAVAMMDGNSLGGFIILGAVTIFGLFVAAGAIKRRIAESKLGPVSIGLTPEAPGPGESVNVSLDFTPKRGALVNAVTAEIAAVERVVRGSGTNRRTYTHTIHQHSVRLLSDPRQLSGKEKVELHGTYKLPGDAPLSFDFPDNELEWSATLRVDIETWPDWVKKGAFIVAPNARLTAADGSGESPVAVASAPSEGLW